MLDFDGDGFADVAVTGEDGAGTVTVFHGEAGLSFARVRTFAAPQGSPPFFGAAVARAGDVDGDGDDDLVVGAPGASPFCPSAGVGAAYLYAGVREGIGTADPVATFTWGDEGDGFGASVAGAGDVDGDGLADVAVGAPCAQVAGVGAEAGRVFLFLGGGAVVPLDGPEPGANAGVAIAGGDVDGDGFSDVAVGAPDIDGPSEAVHVYLGGGVLGAAPDYTAPSGAAGIVGFGRTVALGDIDADGLADLCVGAPFGPGGGSVFVLLARVSLTIVSTTLGPTPGS